MTERVHYSRAPIIEAIIDLRVTQAQEVTIENLALIQDAVADRYPRQERMYSGQVSIPVGEVGKPGQVETVHQQIGFRFIDQAGQRIFQARLDGFAFSILAPYDRWEPFRDEARHLWGVYRSVTRAESITRAAVRYINRIDVRAPMVRIEDYLRTYPEIPSDWSYQDLQTYFMQLQIPQDDLGCMVVINQATAPPPNPETTSILLDLDLFRAQYEEPWQADDDAGVWAFLEQLHDRKNEYFERSITNATRELIR
jgi:uncharacterized protein (TIGR04255 family)